MTTPASPKLKEYDRDSQLPTSESILVVENLTPEAAAEPEILNTQLSNIIGEQSMFINSQTDHINLLNSLIYTSVQPIKKASTQMRSVDLLLKHIIIEK